jgi:hypothetical protein
MVSHADLGMHDSSIRALAGSPSLLGAWQLMLAEDRNLKSFSSSSDPDHVRADLASCERCCGL